MAISKQSCGNAGSQAGLWPHPHPQGAPPTLTLGAHTPLQSHFPHILHFQPLLDFMFFPLLLFLPHLHLSGFQKLPLWLQASLSSPRKSGHPAPDLSLHPSAVSALPREPRYLDLVVEELG